MSRIRGFPPICRADARTLILGSMPSVESLRQQRYYAHPRNAFWPIMCRLLGIESENYEERTRQVQQHGIAIWDTLQACFRDGSLDSAIDERSIVANDFAAFFQAHPAIDRVFFNGAKSEQVYVRHVLPGLDPQQQEFARVRLPSTSPANATLSMEQKLEQWRRIID